MNGKESLEKYHCTVPCRMCEYDEREKREMPCLVCVVRPNFSKDILRIEYRKFTPKKAVQIMATCKDCVHSPVCRLPFNTSKTQVNFAEECHHFKNKADFVEVVHCKDCKHYKTDSYYCQKTKQGYCEFDNTVKQKQGYCSYGERRCDE